MGLRGIRGVGEGASEDPADVAPRGPPSHPLLLPKEESKAPLHSPWNWHPGRGTRGPSPTTHGEGAGGAWL